MKKSLLLLLLSTASLFAATQAVVFDFGGVMVGKPDIVSVVHFLRESLQLSATEFEKANLDKRKAAGFGITEDQFWCSFAQERGIHLPSDWSKQFNVVIKNAMRVNQDMYEMVHQLRARHISVALLSNVDTRMAKIIQEFELYQPFVPCLLSCEIGVDKPDPRAYEILLQKLKIPPANVVFIDDKQANVDAAKKAGIDAIVFTSPEQIRSELKKRSLL